MEPPPCCACASTICSTSSPVAVADPLACDSLFNTGRHAPSPVTPGMGCIRGWPAGNFDAACLLSLYPAHSASCGDGWRSDRGQELAIAGHFAALVSWSLLPRMEKQRRRRLARSVVCPTSLFLARALRLRLCRIG